MSRAAHWQRAYRDQDTEELSWTEAVPDSSLTMIGESAVPLDAAIIDVGAGASRLPPSCCGAATAAACRSTATTRLQSRGL